METSKIKITKEQFNNYFEIIDLPINERDVDILELDLEGDVLSPLPTEAEILAEPIKEQEYKDLLVKLGYRDKTIDTYFNALKCYFRGNIRNSYTTSFKIYKTLFGYKNFEPEEKNFENTCSICRKTFYSSKPCNVCSIKCSNKKHNIKTKKQKEIAELEAKLKELKGE